MREDAMADSSLEKRICVRFQIPGAEVKYKKEPTFFKKTDFTAESLPLIDISRGGIRFFDHEIPKFDTRLTIQLFLPDERGPLVLAGIVRWFSPNPDARYKYQIGVQLLPYGESRDHNPSEILKKIIALEEKYLSELEPEDIPETV
jgi:hypothetical protein